MLLQLYMYVVLFAPHPVTFVLPLLVTYIPDC